MAFFSKARGILQHKITNHIGREISASTPFIFEAIRCMSSKLFVGGLSYQTDEGTLRQAFEKYGQVFEARIIVDRDSGNSRGFGFVTFDSAEAASSAIMALDGQDLQGRRIKVNHAHDRGQGYGSGRGYNNFGGNNEGGEGYNNYGGDNGGGGGYNNYGGNNGGGGGYNNYGNVGNYGSNYGGGGEHGTNVGNYSDGNYRPSSGGDYGAGSTYPNSGGNQDTGNSFTGGNVYQGENFNYAGENNQNFGVAAGGGGGNDNYIADGGNGGSNFTSSGYENNSGLSYGGGDQFGNNVNSDISYDNEPDDFQERRAS